MSKKERAKLDAQWEDQKLMKEWLYKIRETDKDMPRYLEDHIENAHNGVCNNEFQQTAYDNKKKLRSQKPKT